LHVPLEPVLLDWLRSSIARMQADDEKLKTVYAQGMIALSPEAEAQLDGLVAH
jgi:hypothetical protein